MKKQYGKDCAIGGITGTVIYLIDILIVELAYLYISDQRFNLIFFASIIFGIAFCVIALLYKKTCMISIIIRFLMLLISYSLLVIIIESLGLIPMIEQLLKIESCPSCDAVSGLMSITFMSILIFACITTIATKAIIKGLQHLKK